MGTKASSMFLTVGICQACNTLKQVFECLQKMKTIDINLLSTVAFEVKIHVGMMWEIFIAYVVMAWVGIMMAHIIPTWARLIIGGSHKVINCHHMWMSSYK